MLRSDRLALAFSSGALAPPERGDILVLNAQPSDAYDLLGPGRVIAEQGFRPIHDALAARGLRAATEARGPAAMVVTNLARARAASLGDIARGLQALAPGGTFVVNGAKTDGIEGIRGQLAALIPLRGSFAKAHGKVIWLGRPDALPQAVAGWAAAAAPRRNAEGFLAAPGMFSPNAADPGSRRLAAHLPDAALAGRVADLGAGWGWLAAQALAASPRIVGLDLYEAEASALTAARANLTDPRAAFHWADVNTLGAELGTAVPPYDFVVSNPPFHHGRAADPALGAGFIAAAARILKPAGGLLMVANRQLPYEAELQARFRDVATLEEDRAFKVLAAARPRRGRDRSRAIARKGEGNSRSRSSASWETFG